MVVAEPVAWSRWRIDSKIFIRTLTIIVLLGPSFAIRANIGVHSCAHLILKY